jgi:hypothetical protein
MIQQTATRIEPLAGMLASLSSFQKEGSQPCVAG